MLSLLVCNLFKSSTSNDDVTNDFGDLEATLGLHPIKNMKLQDMQQAQTKDVVRVYSDAIQSVERRVTDRPISVEYADT